MVIIIVSNNAFEQYIVKISTPIYRRKYIYIYIYIYIQYIVAVYDQYNYYTYM